MVSIFRKSLLGLSFTFASCFCVQALTVSECVSKLHEVVQLCDAKSINNIKILSFKQNSASFTEEELIELCDQMLLYRKDLGDKTKDIDLVKNELISYLKSFVASGMDIAIDPNFAFIYDEQNPNFTVTFKNPAGEVRTIKYTLKVWSIGLKFEFVIKLDGIFILGSDFNYYDSIGKEYELGSGIDLGYYPKLLESEAKWHAARDGRMKSAEAWVRFAMKLSGMPEDQADSISFDVLPEPYKSKTKKRIDKAGERQKEKWHFGICCTCCKIKETDSVLAIVGLGVGWGGSLVTGTGIEASYVFGGKMTPVQETA